MDTKYMFLLPNDVVVHNSFPIRLSGLLGSNNGNMNDDFTDPDGRSMGTASTMSDNDILSYGQLCKLQ